jgi:hypothetical protein
MDFVRIQSGGRGAASFEMREHSNGNVKDYWSDDPRTRRPMHSGQTIRAINYTTRRTKGTSEEDRHRVERRALNVHAGKNLVPRLGTTDHHSTHSVLRYGFGYLRV